MSLDERFTKAADMVAKFKPVADADLIELYSLYKQATTGDVNRDKPAGADARTSAKYNGWVSKKGLSKDTAKEAYITKAEQVKPLYT